MSEGGLSWVDALLSRWGRWSIRRESGALGFASSCILACSGDGDAFDTAIPRGVADQDIELVDLAVARLPIISRIIVIQVYQRGPGLSIRKNAEVLGINKITLGKFLADVHRKIALDMSVRYDQNSRQSVNGGSTLERKEPAAA